MSHKTIEVRYVAKLARLDLTEEEATLFQSQLEAILGHVESLTAIELPDDLEDDTHSHLAIMRSDTPRENLNPPLVLGNAPDQPQQQIRVPKVVADA